MRNIYLASTATWNYQQDTSLERPTLWPITNRLHIGIVPMDVISLQKLCEMGVTCQRWGRHYDHGLVSCAWKCRVRSKRVHERPIDYSPLENKDNGALRGRFHESVRTHIDNSLCDPDNASAGLARLTKCITAAAHETLQVKQKLSLRKRNVSARTKQLYESRRRHFTTLSENERKEISNAISKSPMDGPSPFTQFEA